MDDDTEFREAMHDYKLANRRPFPTWCEVLEVLKSLGYRSEKWPEVVPFVNERQPTPDDDPRPALVRCSEPGCRRVIVSRGLCHMHYGRWLRAKRNAQ